MMVCDNHIRAARVGIVNCFVRGDSCIAADDEFGTMINNRLETFDMYAVPLLPADRNVINDIRAEHLECLHQQGSGGLPVHIEVTPHTDHVIFVDSLINDLYCKFNIWKWSRWNFIGMQECTGGVGSQNPAADESLRDEGRQVQVREGSGDVYRMRVQPASHVGKYHVSGVRWQV